VNSRPLLAFFPVIVGLAVFAGCATSSPESTEEAEFATRYADFTYCEVPRIRQSAQKSCGAAALTSVIHYWRADSQVTEPGLIKAYPADSKHGYPLLQLKEVAEAEGLLAFALGMDREPLAQVIEHVAAGRPVIAALELPKGRYFQNTVPVIETTDRRTVTGLGDKIKAHYVVVMGTSRDRVLLMDPQYGYVDISQAEFNLFWKAMAYPALVCSEKPAGLQQR
jgi:predicted double-glycine peptidase